MTENILLLLGGVGLFLFGLHVMTEALRQLASEQARQLLGRFTRTPLSGTITGALSTAAIQSSTATMVTAVGFVGAGLLTFPQALGIIFGTSIGTTATGWMIVLLGIKLQITLLAFPMLFAAALVRLLAKGQAARFASALAGLSLLFLGIDFMQTGLDQFDDLLTPESFPAATWLGRLQLVGIGILVTMITQSSSAGVAGTIILLGAGAVSFEQAAAMAIGMHMGTAFTSSLLMTIGGSLAVRRTAVANVIHHVATGLLALLFIDLAAWALQVGWVGDSQLALVSFHTGFNVIGAAVMLPLTGRFAALVERMVPERAAAPHSAILDRRLIADPGAALDTAAEALHRVTGDLFTTLAQSMRGDGLAVAAPTADYTRSESVLTEVQDYLSLINIAEDRPGVLQRYNALVHQIDHLRRLSYRCSQGARLRAVVRDPRLRRHATVLRSCLDRYLAETEPGMGVVARLARLEARIGVMEARVRHVSTHRPQYVHGMTPAEIFTLTDALRWARRSTNHVQRVIFYENEARSAPAIARAEAEAEAQAMKPAAEASGRAETTATASPASPARPGV